MESLGNSCADKSKLLHAFVLAAGTPIKIIPLLLIPSVALLVSACAPAGPGYYGGGPGYSGHDTVYVEGQDHGYDHDHRDYHDSQYNRSVTNVNDVNVNRTVVNDRTVNRTNVNQTNLTKKNVQVTSKNQAHKHNNKPTGQASNGQGDQQDQNHQ